MIAAVSTVFVYAVVVVFCVSSHWPGVHKLSTSRFPLVYGFMESFGIERKRALLLSFPAVYATCFGYSYSYGRLMCSLARSGMLPKFMSGVRGERESPIVAMIGGNLLTFCVMLILNYTEAPQECITGAGLIATFIVVFSVFASFCIFRIKFTTLKKEYSNPFGMASAVVGSVIFILPVLYVVFFRSFSRLTLLVSGMFLTLISLYYYFWARYTLCYSKEEQSILLVLYVMKGKQSLFKINHEACTMLSIPPSQIYVNESSCSNPLFLLQQIACARSQANPNSPHTNRNLCSIRRPNPRQVTAIAAACIQPNSFCRRNLQQSLVHTPCPRLYASRRIVCRRRVAASRYKSATYLCLKMHMIELPRT